MNRKRYTKRTGELDRAIYVGYRAHSNNERAEHLSGVVKLQTVYLVFSRARNAKHYKILFYFLHIRRTLVKL